MMLREPSVRLGETATQQLEERQSDWANLRRQEKSLHAMGGIQPDLSVACKAFATIYLGGKIRFLLYFLGSQSWSSLWFLGSFLYF